MPLKIDPYPNLWFPFTYHQDVKERPPIQIVKGKGIYLKDKKGKTYLDAISSWWVNILGHNHPQISLAVKRQLDRLEHVLMAGFISAPALELSHLLAGLVPIRRPRIFYSDDGSTAVEAAMKIALQYWHLRREKRNEFLALRGAYHGDTLGAMSVGNISQYHSLFHRTFRKQHYALSPYCFRCPKGKKKRTCRAECMDSLAEILDRRKGRIAACIFEPMVQGAAGMRVYPAKALRKLFRICRQHGVLTIADEVATGFGRTGKLFACLHAGQVPDIMCVAKGLTGGYLPMSATIAKEHIFEEFSGDFRSGRIFHHGHSFTGNALAAAAACATMKIVRCKRIPESLRTKFQHFQKGLRKFEDLDMVGDVRSIGMIGAVELTPPTKKTRGGASDNRIPYLIAQKAVERGLLIRPLGNVLYFMPPFVIRNREIDTMFSVARQAIEDVVNA